MATKDRARCFPSSPKIKIRYLSASPSGLRRRVQESHVEANETCDDTRARARDIIARASQRASQATLASPEDAWRKFNDAWTKIADSLA